MWAQPEKSSAPMVLILGSNSHRVSPVSGDSAMARLCDVQMYRLSFTFSGVFWLVISGGALGPGSSPV